MIEKFLCPLPHGITLSCRASGERGRPVLLFLHGFPQGAFVWDELLEYFSQPAHGGYRCVAPNLRGFEHSSAPAEVSAYRPKHLVQDISALMAIESPEAPLAALVAHDWGGAVAWNLANQRPELMQRLAIINSPHPGTFLRELKTSEQQQHASAYMNFLIQPGSEEQLAADDFAMLWTFLGGVGDDGPGHWLTDDLKERHREVWRQGLRGGCNFYRASPLRPATPTDPAADAVELPDAMLTIALPTLVLWGLRDKALAPGLIQGLERYIPRMNLQTVPEASHWIVHEQPALVRRALQEFLQSQ